MKKVSVIFGLTIVVVAVVVVSRFIKKAIKLFDSIDNEPIGI